MSDNVPINSLKLNRFLRESCKYNNNAFNFIFSHKCTIVCFIHLKGLLSLITVTDSDFNPLFLHKVDAIIAQCNISTNGKYIAWQTANSNSDDSNSIFFYDVVNKNLLWKHQAYIHSKYLKGIYIFDFVEVQYDDVTIKYDFQGNEIDDKMNYYTRLKSKCISPYFWNSEVLKIIDALDNDFHSHVETLVLERIDLIESNDKMSKFQLSQTYKRLGDCYLNHNYKLKALNTYKKGLSLSEKLPVKRIIAKLESELDLH